MCFDRRLTQKKDSNTITLSINSFNTGLVGESAFVSPPAGYLYLTDKNGRIITDSFNNVIIIPE